MLAFILYLVVIGLVAGFLARAIVPGRDSMSVGETIVLGIVGSFIGGFLGYVIFNKDLDEGGLQASGIIGSLIGAVIALLIYRKLAGGTVAGTASPPAAPTTADRERRQAERRERRERRD